MADYPTSPTNFDNRLAKRRRESSTLFWIVVGCASVLSLGLITWGASVAMAKRGGEKLIRTDVLFRKLDAVVHVRKDAHSEPKVKDVAPPKKAIAPPPPMLTEAPRPVALDLLPLIVQSSEPPPFKIPVPTLINFPEPFSHPIPKSDLTPPPIVETCADPIIYLHPCTIHRGDSPMTHNWKMLTMYTALSAATVFIAPQPIVFAQAQEKKAEVSDELLKSLQDISKRLDALEKKKTPTLDTDAITEALRAEIRKLENGLLSELQSDIKGVKKSVDAIKTDVGTLQSEQLRQKLKIEQLAEEITLLKERLKTGPVVGTTPAAVDKTMFEELGKSLKAIHDAITKLGPTEKRIMMSPPSTNGTPNIATPVTPSVGRVVLTNLYTDDLLFTVNGTPYRIAAKASKVVDVPTGTMTYEVFSSRWGMLERNTTAITAGDTFTLAANSR